MVGAVSLFDLLYVCWDFVNKLDVFASVVCFSGEVWTFCDLFCNEASSWAAGWFGWCLRMCPLSLSRAVKELWQLWHRYGRSPVWRNMCRTRELLWRKLKGQCSQKWFFSSAWICNEVICIKRMLCIHSLLFLITVVHLQLRFVVTRKVRIFSNEFPLLKMCAQTW